MSKQTKLFPSLRSDKSGKSELEKHILITGPGGQMIIRECDSFRWCIICQRVGKNDRILSSGHYTRRHALQYAKKFGWYVLVPDEMT